VAQGLRANPFYVLLVITGLAFAITACGFGVMTFTDVHGPELLDAAQQESAGRMVKHPLFVFLDEHGTKTMLVELAILAVATIGCIAADSWMDSRQLEPDPKDRSRAIGENKMSNDADVEEATSVTDP